MPPTMNNLFLIIVALLLVALNGFFVAAEFGLVKLRQTRIREIAKTQGLARTHSGESTFKTRRLFIGLPAGHYACFARLGLGRRTRICQPAGTRVRQASELHRRN